MPDKIIFRSTTIEIDFLNELIIFPSQPTYVQGETPAYRKIPITKEIANRFLNEQVDIYWHSEKDQLEFFASYSDGSYFCQRKRLRYDFKTKVNYWSTYNFSDASSEQVSSLTKKVTDLYLALTEIKAVKYDTVFEEINKELMFFDQRWAKKFREKQMMLSASDWRVLPDVEDSYTGEKDMWIKWRSSMRNDTVKKPTEFETGLDFLKYLYAHKWPIDPKKYKTLYPNREVEYLATEDQWVVYDTEASTDFTDTRLINMMNNSDVYREKIVDIKSSVYNMMKDLRLEEFAEIDYDRYNTVE